MKNKTDKLECSNCGGQCCQYVALQIDTPKTMEDFDHIRWYLAHEKIAIFIEKTSWYLQINNACKYLSENGKCQIYERRPKICRDYGLDSEGEIECHGPEQATDHDYFFTTLEELEAYLIKKKKKWSSLKLYSKK